VEEEYAAKLKELEDRHRSEIAALGGDDTGAADNNARDINDSANIDNAIDTAAIERQKKLEKIRQQKEAERQRIIEQERQAIEDAKNIGPTLRDIEMDQIIQQLQPHQLRIQPIPADGNCLFRAIAAQCHVPEITDTVMTYQDVRTLCAQIMRDQESEFAPFCEYNPDQSISNYQEYVHSVQHNSHHWGGHLELRALSMALQRPIHVYSSNTLHSNGPLIIDASQSSSSSDAEDCPVEPIRLSYHLHYYALGEHYNQVVVMDSNKDDSNIER
jgi:OTU domain-containing protein 6